MKMEANELTEQDMPTITTEQASAITGLSRQRINQMCRAGQIKAERVARDGFLLWLIDEQSVRDYKPGKGGRKKVTL